MGLLELIALVLFVGWVLGLVFHIAGSFIHFLLVVAAIVLLFRFVRKER
jgi:hypothetical protein